jgi:hypothetical protein
MLIWAAYLIKLAWNDVLFDLVGCAADRSAADIKHEEEENKALSFFMDPNNPWLWE